MKYKLVLILLLITGIAPAQQISYLQWQQMEKTNPMLQPKLGYQTLPHTIKNTRDSLTRVLTKKFVSAEAASDYLIQQGAQYLYQDDLVTAMHRFNQAYLMDSTNTDIYWGYGEVYAAMGQHMPAREQYLQGLALDPQNDRLLTANGTTYLAEYYLNMSKNPNLAKTKLDTAVQLMQRAYALEPTSGNTNYKLSICYYNQNKCPLAWKHLRIAEALQHPDVTRAYKKDLETQCPAPAIDCSSMRKGNYTMTIDGIRYKIQRQEDYQIETDLDAKSKSKIKIEWQDGCSYTLTYGNEIKNPAKQKIQKDLIVDCTIVSQIGKEYTLLVLVHNDTLHHKTIYEMTKQ